MPTTKPTAFVLMPFAPEFDDIYRLFLHPTLTECGFDVKRADDITSQQNILRDVINGIVDRDLIIADLTGANPNVFYELGVAHALGKPVILITQNIDKLPFDLEHTVAWGTAETSPASNKLKEIFLSTHFNFCATRLVLATLSVTFAKSIQCNKGLC